MNTGHVLRDINNKSDVTFNFLEALKSDSIPDASIYAGDKSIHYFICGVDSKPNDEKNFDDVTLRDNYLQSLTLVKFWVPGLLSGSPHTLLMVDQKVRDVTTRDINELHFLLGIETILPETSIANYSGGQPIVLFQWCLRSSMQFHCLMQ